MIVGGGKEYQLSRSGVTKLRPAGHVRPKAPICPVHYLKMGKKKSWWYFLYLNLITLSVSHTDHNTAVS